MFETLSIAIGVSGLFLAGIATYCARAAFKAGERHHSEDIKIQTKAGRPVIDVEATSRVDLRSGRLDFIVKNDGERAMENVSVSVHAIQTNTDGTFDHMQRYESSNKNLDINGEIKAKIRSLTKTVIHLSKNGAAYSGDLIAPYPLMFFVKSIAKDVPPVQKGHYYDEGGLFSTDLPMQSGDWKNAYYEMISGCKSETMGPSRSDD